jgi:hypothetical protein
MSLLPHKLSKSLSLPYYGDDEHHQLVEIVEQAAIETISS